MWDTPVDDLTRAVLEQLGRQVRAARHHAGLSQRQVEAMTGIDQTTIVRIEQGKATGMPLRRFARLLYAINAGVATRRPPFLVGMAVPGSSEWVNDGPAWDRDVGDGISLDDDDPDDDEEA
jgi:transcriptional regulator with XRE-family HTH domain